MNFVLIVLAMIFCHTIADYNLQGWLVNAKQRDYWEKNAPDRLYKHDFIMALFMHSFTWTFMVMLPILFFNRFSINVMFLVLFIANIVIHMYIDHLKANKKKINLCFDQFSHLLQIFCTAYILS